MAKYTDEQIKKALECCSNWEAEYCEKCPFGDECDNDGDTPLRNALDLINRYEADINNIGIALEVTRDNLGDRLVELQQAEVENDELQREIAEYKSEIAILKDSNKNLQELYYTEREKVEKAKQRVINIARALQNAKSEAIKEFWNQRPPMLNPNFKGKEQYNKGWNDCISFFAEEYKILLGIEKRNENECPDTAEEMAGEEE